MHDQDVLAYRIGLLETALEQLRSNDIGQLRAELHTDYLNKYQLQNEYLSRMENQRYIEATQKRKREWPVIAAGLLVACASVGSLILQAIGH